jgi:nitroreductase
MNPVLEVIKKRRSVRSFESKPVPRDVLLTVIDAANEAPSAMNTQPWRFVVVENADFRKKMVETAIPRSLQLFEAMKESSPERYKIIKQRYAELQDPIYYSAPQIIFVIGSNAAAADSCLLACENLILAAESLGLGSCYVRTGALVADNAEIAKAFDIQGDERIFGPVLLGYARETPKPPPKNPPKIRWI